MEKYVQRVHARRVMGRNPHGELEAYRRERGVRRSGKSRGRVLVARTANKHVFVRPAGEKGGASVVGVWYKAY